MNQRELSGNQNNANLDDYLVQTLQFTDQKTGYQGSKMTGLSGLYALHTDGARTFRNQIRQTSTCKF